MTWLAYAPVSGRSKPAALALIALREQTACECTVRLFAHSKASLTACEALSPHVRGSGDRT